MERALFLFSLLFAVAFPITAISAQTTYYCNGLEATIVGTDSDNPDDGYAHHGIDDYLVGTDGADVIVGLGGDDDIRAGKGNDEVCSGAGVDEVYGMAGADWIDCGADNDSCHGDGGSDTIYLGGTTLPYNGPCSYTEAGCSYDGTNCPSCDALRFGNFGHADTQPGIDNEDYGFYPEGDANDFVYGGSGKEVLFDLGGGNDTFHGYEGNDGGLYRSDASGNYYGLIRGQRGDDTFYGGDGNDQEIHGGFGTDYLAGGRGQDELRGGDGDNDEIRGEYDNDEVYGGPGNNDQVYGGRGDSDDGGGGTGTSDDCFSIENTAGEGYD